MDKYKMRQRMSRVACGAVKQLDRIALEQLTPGI
jgi:hypothetical protein